MKLALSVGRLDFWNLPDEFSRYELSVLQAAYELDPWGNERDDIRNAWSTVVSIVSQAAKKPDDDAMNELFMNLLQFTEVRRHQAENRVDSFSSVQAIFGG